MKYFRTGSHNHAASMSGSYSITRDIRGTTPRVTRDPTISSGLFARVLSQPLKLMAINDKTVTTLDPECGHTEKLPRILIYPLLIVCSLQLDLRWWHIRERSRVSGAGFRGSSPAALGFGVLYVTEIQKIRVAQLTNVRCDLP